MNFAPFSMKLSFSGKWGNSIAMYLTIQFIKNQYEWPTAIFTNYLFTKIFVFKKQIVIKRIPIYIGWNGFWHVEEFCKVLVDWFLFQNFIWKFFSLFWCLFNSLLCHFCFLKILRFSYQFFKVYFNISMWSLAISGQNVTSNVAVLVSASFKYTHF